MKISTTHPTTASAINNLFSIIFELYKGESFDIFGDIRTIQIQMIKSRIWKQSEFVDCLDDENKQKYQILDCPFYDLFPALGDHVSDMVGTNISSYDEQAADAIIDIYIMNNGDAQKIKPIIDFIDSKWIFITKAELSKAMDMSQKLAFGDDLIFGFVGQ